jgi:hypothetical protein
MKLAQISSALLLVPFLALPVGAGEASGQFKVEGRKPITPKHASAYETRSMRDARKKVVEVVLSATPLDIARVANSPDPHAVAINEDSLKDDNYVLLWVEADGSVTMNATYSDSMSQFIESTKDRLKAEFTTNTADKVEGRIFTPKGGKTMDGDKLEVDLKFSTVVSRRPPGTKLAAGGGEVGAGFKKLTTAVEKKDWAGIKGAMTAEQMGFLEEDYLSPEENLKSTLDILKAWLPKKGIKITGGEMRGDKATLEVEGEIFEGKKALYLIEMEKSDGKWLFSSSTPAGFLD